MTAVSPHRVGSSGVTGGLLERDRELARFEAALDQAASRNGSLLALLGQAGIGKTSLLDATGEIAAERQSTVLGARGAQAERQLPFGVARQLFERLLVRSDGESRAELLAGQAALTEPLLDGAPVPAFERDPLAAAHALYWLTENITRQVGLVLLTIDDVQWADLPSLRFLAYLANRLDGVSALVAMAALEGEPASDEPLLDEILAAPGTDVVRPVALTSGATATLLEASLGSAPEPDFARACHAATGGNPYLVRELAAELRANRVAPTGANVEGLSALGPESVARRVCARLARLGGAHIAFGRAFSVLGPGAAILDVAHLAGLGASTATRVADDLARVGLIRDIRPLEFQHPLVARAIYRDVPPLERSRLHADAARVLSDRGASSSVVASQLLEAEPEGDPWVVEQLRAGARRALSRGAPSVAIRALRRALAEPPPPDARPSLLLELGAAAAGAGEPDALDLSREALRLAPDPALRSEAAFQLATALALAGDVDEATRVVEDVLGTLGADETQLTVRLEALLAMLASTTGASRSTAGERLRVVATRPDSLPAPLARVLTSALALERSTGGGTAAEALELAGRALDDGQLLAEQGAESPTVYFAVAALIGADRPDEADRVLTAAIEQARQRSSARGVAIASAVRAYARIRQGDLPGAEEDALGFRQHTQATGSPLLLPSMFAVPSLALVHLERDELEAAQLALDPFRGVSGDASVPVMQSVHDALGRLLLAQGRPEEARREFMLGGRLDPNGKGDGSETGSAPAVFRAGLAQATAALGRPAEAREITSEMVAEARRFGAPRSIGIALRVAGLLDDDPDAALGLLENAVAAHEDSCDRLEHVRSLVELGAARSRAGERKAAREPLRAGREIALRCSATALAERAYTELRTTGARPRKVPRSGVDDLTPSERRVAAMAADGMSNREIAQALFVTVKTIEVHLSHTYQKLEIGSRHELAAALRRSPTNLPGRA